MPPNACSAESSSHWCGDVMVDTPSCRSHSDHHRRRHHHAATRPCSRSRSRSRCRRRNDCKDSGEDQDLLNLAAAELEAMRSPPPSALLPSCSSNCSFPAACLALLSSLPGNHRCIDCHAPASVDSGWAAASYGAVLCLSCSGRHRGLGVRKSFVKSLTMDEWSRCEVLAMLEGGNDQLASFFERHKLGRHDPLLVHRNRYETKAAQFYRRHLAKHAAALAAQTGRYRGREASRSEAASSSSSSSSSSSRSPCKRKEQH